MWVVYVFVVQLVVYDDDYGVGCWSCFVQFYFQCVVQVQIGEYVVYCLFFGGQQCLEMGFELVVFEQQVVEVVIEEVVFLDQFEEYVEEQLCIFDVVYVVGCIEQFVQFGFVVGEQCVDKFVFGWVVVIEIVWVDFEFG